MVAAVSESGIIVSHFVLQLLHLFSPSSQAPQITVPLRIASVLYDLPEEYINIKLSATDFFFQILARPVFKM